MNPLPWIFIVILDDIGNDRLPRSISSYSKDPVHMPWLEQMASTGAVYTRFYTQAICSPSRASLLRGHQPWNTGIGRGVQAGSWNMPDSPHTLLKVARRAGLDTAAFGKWHLDLENPADAAQEGADVYSLTPTNIDDYRNFAYWKNGRLQISHQYATSWLINEVDGWVTMDCPRLVWLAPHAAHAPFHVPPRYLYSGPQLTEFSSDDEKYAAACEALDVSLACYFWGLPAYVREHSWWFIFSDNGTASHVSRAPEGQRKGSMGEGGIRNTLIAWNDHVVDVGFRSAPVSICDIYATVSDILSSEVLPDPNDSASLLPNLLSKDFDPIRPWAMSGKHEPNGSFLHADKWAVAVIDERLLKLKRRRRLSGEVVDRMYDLNTAPDGEDGDPVNHEAPPYADDYVRLSALLDQQLP